MANEQHLPVTFSSFIVSLGGVAMEHMGFSQREGAVKELSLARQNIALIELLGEKTRGNLDGEEQKLMESLLVELRLKWKEAGGGDAS